MAGREEEKKVKNEGFHNRNISTTNYENLHSTSYNERERREREENDNMEQLRVGMQRGNERVEGM